MKQVTAKVSQKEGSTFMEIKADLASEVADKIISPMKRP
jgi:hypothetical protein